MENVTTQRHIKIFLMMKCGNKMETVTTQRHIKIVSCSKNHNKHIETKVTKNTKQACKR
jgi:hypothetical protein